MAFLVDRYVLVQTTTYYKNGLAPTVSRRYSKNSGTIFSDEYDRAARTIPQDRMKIAPLITYGVEFNQTQITYSFERDKFPNISRRVGQIFARLRTSLRQQ